MQCTKCGYENENSSSYCVVCGNKLEVPVQSAPPVYTETPPVSYQNPAYTQQPAYNPQQTVYNTQPVYYPPVQPQMPDGNKAMSPWAYFAYQLLFSLPVVGFIMLLVFSFDDSNLHRRNFARSYWCALLAGVVLTILIVVLLSTTGIFNELMYELTYY